MNYVLHANERKREDGVEKEAYPARGGAAVVVGGGDGGRRCSSFFFLTVQRREPLFFFFHFLFFSSVLFPLLYSILFSVLLLSRPSVPLFFSFLFSVFRSLSSLSFPSFFSPSPVFIGKNRGGRRGWGDHCAAAPNRPRGKSPSFFHHVASKWVVGVFLRESWRWNRRKKIIFFFPASRVQGKKKTWVSFKTAPFPAFLLFLFFNSAWNGAIFPKTRPFI